MVVCFVVVVLVFVAVVLFCFSFLATVFIPPDSGKYLLLLARDRNSLILMFNSLLLLHWSVDLSCVANEIIYDNLWK